MSLTHPRPAQPSRSIGDPPRKAEGLKPVASAVTNVLRGLTVRHGPWTIFYDPPPIPMRDCDYGFYHDDFDGSWEGEEGGYVSNGLGGRGASVEDCLAQIADMEAERREAAE